MGLPGEDHDSIEETRRFIEEVSLDDADFTIFQPYRGSPIWNCPSEYDILWDHAPTGQRFYKGRFGEYQCSVSTSRLSSQEILAARDNLEARFRCR